MRITSHLTAVCVLAIAAPTTAAPRFEKTLNRHLAAVIARDLPALEETLTAGPKLELYLPTGKRTATRRDFVDFHREWFAQSTWSMRFAPVSTFVGRDLAIATVQSRYEDVVDGKPYWSESWLTLAFRLEKGKWRLVHDQNTRIKTSQDRAG